MDNLSNLALIVIALITIKYIAESILLHLNRTNVLKNSNNIPDTFKGVMDDDSYQKSIAYTLAKQRFSMITQTFDLFLIIAVLACGVLPKIYDMTLAYLGESVWVQSLYLFLIVMLGSALSMPFDWWSQFRLEERFGFNKSNLVTWLMDKVKGLILGLIIAWPLLTLLIKLVDWFGEYWWIWAFAVTFAFQLILQYIAPKWIMPLFNKFTPLPEGELKDRLMALSTSTGFKTSAIEVMDGSRRSAHSNAFFTGFGKNRKVVLFDTLIEQLEPKELEAVLAHEIGHFKKKHIFKMMALSTIMSLIMFWVIAQLASSPEFYAAFGFSYGSLAPAFLLMGLFSGAVTFWLSPLSNRLSRKHEYEADHYAKVQCQTSDTLIQALRKLSEKNLSNLTPHPVYSAFYYSHPTLMEREAALKTG